MSPVHCSGCFNFQPTSDLARTSLRSLDLSGTVIPMGGLPALPSHSTRQTPATPILSLDARCCALVRPCLRSRAPARRQRSDAAAYATAQRRGLHRCGWPRARRAYACSLAVPAHAVMGERRPPHQPPELTVRTLSRTVPTPPSAPLSSLMTTLVHMPLTPGQAPCGTASPLLQPSRSCVRLATS
jgi:hypothetical protein